MAPGLAQIDPAAAGAWLPAAATRVQLPVGVMAEGARGVRVALAQNARTRAHVRSIVERLDGAAAEYFWIPTTVDDGDDLVLEYALEDAETRRFSAALPALRAAAAVHLPELVEMARYLAAAVTHLERMAVPAVIAPACLRYAPRRAEGSWRLLVVPLVDATLADWARSSPEAWAWAPAAVLIGKAASPGAYAIGAALCAALAGDVFPPDAPAGERLRRALRGWIGDRARLDAAVRAALPESFAEERAALVALVIDLLEPAPPPDWRARLERLGEQLAPYRTAVRWEYEGDVAVARGILERVAASRPARHVPWEVLSRLRGREQDASGALDAAISALGAADSVRELAAVARRIAGAALDGAGGAGGGGGGGGGGGAAAAAMIARAVAAADGLGARLGDLGRLHFAHLEARYLGRFAEAAARLAAPMAAPWDETVRQALLARIHAARGEWAHVARLCKQARAATQAMPAGGGGLGAYLVAYLDHLDGVAHHGATTQYADAGYLTDAFARLAASLDAARAACEPGDPLIEANAEWLLRVAALADRLRLREAPTLRIGVDACLAASGLARRAVPGEEPQIVWYDAGRLLALSGAP